MAGYTRGKIVLKMSLDNQNLLQKRRVSPRQDAEYFCRVGLDKDGFERKFINKNIGFGIFATKDFRRGSFLLEYVGERISALEAEKREEKRKRKIHHSYQYFYKWNGHHCIDATQTNRLCKFVNDAETRSVQNNAVMKLIVLVNQPRLCLFASRDIIAGEEVRYDYGEENLPWREGYIDPDTKSEDNEYSDDDPFDLSSGSDDDDPTSGSDGEDSTSGSDEDLTSGSDDEDHTSGSDDEDPTSGSDDEDLTSGSDDDDPTSGSDEDPTSDSDDEDPKLFGVNCQDATAEIDSTTADMIESSSVLDIDIATADMTDSATVVMLDSSTATAGLIDNGAVIDSAKMDEIDSTTAEMKDAAAIYVINSTMEEMMGDNVTEMMDSATAETDSTTVDMMDSSSVLDIDIATSDMTDSATVVMLDGNTAELKSTATAGLIDNGAVIDSAKMDETDSITAEMKDAATTGIINSAMEDIMGNNVTEMEDISMADVSVSATTDMVNNAIAEIDSATTEVKDSSMLEKMDNTMADVIVTATTKMMNSEMAEIDSATAEVNKTITKKIDNATAGMIDGISAVVMDTGLIDVTDSVIADIRYNDETEMDSRKCKVKKSTLADAVVSVTAETMGNRDVRDSVIPDTVYNDTAVMEQEPFEKIKKVTRKKYIKEKVEDIIKNLDPANELCSDDDYDNDDNSYRPSETSESEEWDSGDESSNDDDLDDVEASNKGKNKDCDDNSPDLEQSDNEGDDMSVSTVFPMLSGGNVDKIQFLTAKKSTKGVYSNKEHACVFCEKIMPNMARHLQLVHANEPEVARILTVPKKSKERRQLWQELTNKGDFSHNYSVIAKGKGFIIPKYRKVEASAHQQLINYVPCQYCKAFYKKYDLWKHKESCVSRPKDSKSGKHINSGRLLLPPSCSNKGLEENILKNMKNDDIKYTVIADKRILDLGSRLFDKHGLEFHKFQYISQKLRELGRLLLCSKETSNIGSIDELLCSNNFDMLIQSVRKVCGYKEDSHTFDIPSLALKLGHSLQKCANYMKSEGLKENCQEKIDNAERFLTLYDNEWCDAISSHALSSLYEQKFNKPLLLPLVKDVVKLNKFLTKKAENLCQEIRETPELYSELAQICLAQVILFNRRRSGEAERMPLSAFRKAISSGSGKPDEVVMETLSKFEKTLCTTHTRVEIRGKRGRKVPVLFTQQMKQSLEILVGKREEANITQPYLFARKGSDSKPYRGTDCLRKFSLEAELENPCAITSTKLRKQLATLAQILNLSETSQDILATFQGHNILVHREFYRLPENALQVAKVSKLLHSINNGTISQYQGKDFDDIEFADEAEELESESESENETDIDEVDKNYAADEYFDENGDDQTEVVHLEMKSGKSQKKLPKRILEIKKQSRKERHSWTKDEKDALNRQFKKNISLQKVPNQLQCLNAIKKEPCLAGFSWTIIKFAVKNIIASRRRLCKTS